MQIFGRLPRIISLLGMLSLLQLFEGLTRAMAVDNSTANIRVNSLVVGTVWKEFVEACPDEEVTEGCRRAGDLRSEGTVWDVFMANSNFAKRKPDGQCSRITH